MEGPTSTRKKSGFGFGRKSEEEKSEKSHSDKKKSRKRSAAKAKEEASAEQAGATGKPAEDTGLNSDLQSAEKAKGKKRKRHIRHFSFGGKGHKNRGKETDVAVKEAIHEPSGLSSSDCHAEEPTGSSTTQENSAVRDESVTESSSQNLVPSDDSQPTQLNTVPLADESLKLEAEETSGTSVKAEKRTTTMKQTKHKIVPDPSSQSESDKIGGATRSEFQIIEEEEVEIPYSPKDTRTEDFDLNEGKNSHATRAEMALKFPTTAEGQPTQTPEVANTKTSPTCPEAVVEESKKEQNVAIPGIGTLYQVLLRYKELLLSDEKQGRIGVISTISYKIYLKTVDKGLTKFLDLLNFLLGQAGHSTRHVVFYFVKILVKKYPHCFQVKAIKRKSIKPRGNDAIQDTIL